jgi:5-methyltetrahydrofolate--homocysteine methyltransferase
MGDVMEEELYAAFREQAEALERGGADAVCIETMTALDEAGIAVRAAKEHTDLEIIASFTFDREVNGVYHTMMGVNPEQMATAMLEAGADILGANCSLGPAEMVSVVRGLRAGAPDTPILVHPNAGQPVLTDAGVVYPESPAKFAARVPALLDVGANILGGCCGTTPEHIRALAAAVAGA